MQFRYRPAGRTARAFSSERRAPQGSRLGPVGSFVDDLKPNRVLYGVRAALLQRSLEIQPAFSTIRFRILLSLCILFFYFAFFSLFFGPSERFGLLAPQNGFFGGLGAVTGFGGFLLAYRKEKNHKGVPGGAPVLAPGAALSKAYLLGLLAKIKCSICSYQLNLWYVAHGVTSD